MTYLQLAELLTSSIALRRITVGVLVKARSLFAEEIVDEAVRTRRRAMAQRIIRKYKSMADEHLAAVLVSLPMSVLSELGLQEPADEAALDSAIAAAEGARIETALPALPEAPTQ